MAEPLRDEMLVPGDWLQAHLGDTDLRIVDCDSRGAFGKAHLPGAVWSPRHPYKDPGRPLHVMEPAQFAAAMSDLGIGNDTLVVAYDDAASVSASRLWWCLRYFGHTNVKVLDGGFDRWLRDGRPVTMAETPVTPARFTPQVDESLLATADYVMAALANPDAVILDVRSDAEWDGSRKPGANQRGGHIPGSVHMEYTQALTSGGPRRVKPEEELRELFAACGVTPDKEVITI